MSDEKSLPKGWKEYTDIKTQKKYYCNKKLSMTVWNRSEIFQIENDESSQDQKTTGDDKLPPGWKKIVDKTSGNYYYHNKKLGLTTWEKPEVPLDVPPPLPTSSPPSDPSTSAPPPLPSSNHPSVPPSTPSTPPITPSLTPVADGPPPPPTKRKPVAFTNKTMDNILGPGGNRNTVSIMANRLPFSADPDPGGGGGGMSLTVPPPIPPSKPPSLTHSYSMGKISSPKTPARPPGSAIRNDRSLLVNPTGLPVLPPFVKDQIHQFQFKGFAEHHFAEQKKGLVFKKIVPLDTLLSFSRESITQPLLSSVHLKFLKEAIKNFDEILTYTGVKSSKVISSTRYANTIMNRGNTTPELRDEIYCQLCKQTSPTLVASTAKKDKDANRMIVPADLIPYLIKTWELFMIMTSSFPPSRHFEATLLNYLDALASSVQDINMTNPTTTPFTTSSSSTTTTTTSSSSSSSSLPTPEQFSNDVACYYSQYCLNALHNTTLFGGRSEIDEKRLQEIRGIKESTKQFNISVGQIMFHQMKLAPPGFNIIANPVLEEADGEKASKDTVAAYNKQLAATPHPIPTYMYPIPKLIPIMAIRTLQNVGVYEEGIFRKCINMQLLDQYIQEVDAGKAEEITVPDCHAYAVILKTWLRKLVDPLIPDTKYKLALAFVRDMMDDDDESNEPTYGSTNADTFYFYNSNETNTVSPITEFVNKHLNPVHNLSLKYLIRFLRIFTIDPYVQTNLMHMDNIALVMAPNLIHLKTSDPKDALVNLQLEIKFAYCLIRELCITADEETLFEYLDTSIRKELNVPTDARGCSILNYYTWS